MANLTKRDLVVRISNETGLVQKGVSSVIDRILQHLIDALARGEAVEFRNFGIFHVSPRKARIGRNPQRPDRSVTIPACMVVKFKAGKDMRARVMALVHNPEDADSSALPASKPQK